MTIDNLYCNAEIKNEKSIKFIALPVIAWDVCVETSNIQGHYFPDLVKKILSVGDKTIAELHSLTNLDEKLLNYILRHDLKGQGVFGIDKWHLKENTSSIDRGVKESRLTLLQSKVTGRLLPHPVRSNDLKSIDYDLNEKERPVIEKGTRGSPIRIQPWMIFKTPDNFQPNEITEDDIDGMWQEYEEIDSELVMSGMNILKSSYIDHPDRIASISKRLKENNETDYLLIKVNSLGDGKDFNCFDLLESSDDIPMDFLNRELTKCMECDEGLAIALGIERIEISIELRERIQGEYPGFPPKVIDEICRFMSLREINGIEEGMDDLILARFQTTYECLLKTKDVEQTDDFRREIRVYGKNDVYNVKREERLKIWLGKKCLELDEETLRALGSLSVWQSATKREASLKSLILRHLMTYLISGRKGSWFIESLVDKWKFKETLRFLVDMANARNKYQHYSTEREKLPCEVEEIFEKVENQLKVFSEVYGS